jgi:UPF0755 protein
MRVIRWLLIGGFVCFLALLGTTIGGWLWVQDHRRPPADLPFHPPRSVTIRSGSSSRDIGAALKDRGVIRSAFLFRLAVSFYSVDQRLRPGTFRFTGRETLEEVLAILLKGQEITRAVTIPEGWTLLQIASRLEEAGICSGTAFLQAAHSPSLLAECFGTWNPAPVSGEGLTFPETYRFPREISATETARLMFRMTKRLVEQLRQTAPPATDPPRQESPLSFYETCILASIVERETKRPEEFPLVASVFHNRLRRRIRLESCATVQFALGEHKERLTFADLRVQSPFNTYQNDGLPPTPIANFGRRALEATLWPAVSEYLFFVSDAADGHRFSQTHRDHERSRQEFFQKRRTRNSKGPSR